MKRSASIFGIFALSALFMFVSCNQQQSGSDVREDLAELRENTQEVIHKIDEALAMTDVSDFRSQAQDAMDELDNQIDEYHNTMDNADMRIDSEARETIINMKQKRAAIEFKLDLLDNGNGWGSDETGTRRTDDRTRTDGTGDRTGTDWTDDQEGRQQTDRPRDTDLTQDDPERTEWADRDRDVNYAPEVMNEVRNDLQELRTEVEQFMQRHL